MDNVTYSVGKCIAYNPISIYIGKKVSKSYSYCETYTHIEIGEFKDLGIMKLKILSGNLIEPER